MLFQAKRASSRKNPHWQLAARAFVTWPLKELGRLLETEKWILKFTKPTMELASLTFGSLLKSWRSEECEPIVDAYLTAQDCGFASSPNRCALRTVHNLRCATKAKTPFPKVFYVGMVLFAWSMLMGMLKGMRIKN